MNMESSEHPSGGDSKSGVGSENSNQEIANTHQNELREPIVGAPDQSKLDLIQGMVKFLIEKSYNEADDENKAMLAPAAARAQIVIGSVEVFLKYGLELATVQDLLNAAQVSRRTFYKYFKNKTDVIECVYELLVGMLLTRYRAFMAGAKSLNGLIETCVNLFFDYHESLGPLIRLFHEKAASSNSVLPKHRQALQSEFARVFEVKLWELEQVKYDRWIFLSVIWAAESASIHLLTKPDVTPEDVISCKDSIRKVAMAILVDGRARMTVADESSQVPEPDLL